MNAVSRKFGLLALVGLSLMSIPALASEQSPTSIPPGTSPSIVSGCYTISRGPTYDLEWTFSLSLSTDTRMLHQYYPSQCAGNFLCDVVAYRIQAFNGEWSQEYYPGVNDLGLFNGTQRRMWFNFYDHNHAYTFCN